MNSYTLQKLKTAAGALVVALCLGLIVLAQRSVGWGSLGLMVLGLAGLLAVLWLYNRGVEKPRPVGGANNNSEDSRGS
ncbi:hypothetical protein LJC60_09555 [Ruminococcaceae bacterium OttesenSCG-928-D13]|nr:hypothetical protein [Ruminococcaceae bacterium OttesenSCG-928-D13]